MLRKRKYVLITLGLILVIAAYRSFSGTAQKQFLYYGTRGDDVRTLQRRLSNWGYYDGNISGVFGPETSRSVREFQRRNNLQVDGLVGEETWGAMGYRMRPRAPEYGQPETRMAFADSVNRYDNVEMIARLISAEARGEPYEGQVAVGAVLLNRVDSPEFPNSISGVIYQPLAFEAVADGQFNMEPTDQAIRAARAAINGWDPTYGSTFFWNPGERVNPWVWTRPTVRTIGDHIFAR